MKTLIEHFQEHWSKLNLLPDKKLLIAVSGGIDSMVLCDLCLKSKLQFSIAHCNFQLRAEASDLDQKFIENYADQNKIELFTKRFDVEQYKSDKNISTQMAARELRYDWFEELLNEHSFDYLLTAHHLNDSLETFIINLTRGTGIGGLLGIKEVNQKILRPLLPFYKMQIRKYAIQNRLKWRVDQSNASLNYIRNKVRHQITPILEELHPSFLSNFNTSIENLNGDWQLIQNHIESIKKDLFKHTENQIQISIDALKQLNPLDNYIFHLFNNYGFRYPTEIKKLIYSDQNGEIKSKKFRLIKNRSQLILISINIESIPDEIEINVPEIIEKPLYLKVSVSNERDFGADETFDLEKLSLPLRLRKAKTGDSFYPIGMKGRKKVSKFFKDEKYSKLDKENAWILVDNEDRILCILGKRMDERFKITENTHKFLNIYLC